MDKERDFKVNVRFVLNLKGQRASLVAQLVKNPPADAGDTRNLGSIPGLGRSPGEGHSNPPQYSCLENSVDRGVWWATVHGVAELDMTEVTDHAHIIYNITVYYI